MQKSKSITRQCEICGAPALFINFGVISCSSCKMFFKRHAEFESESFPCKSNGCCEINIHTRRLCSACRLAKCFTSGMQIILIRGSKLRKNKKKQTNKMKTIVSNRSEQLSTLSLLRKDRSTLTTDQWTLLSNLIHCYDEHGGFFMASQFISEQNVLPPKLRYKIQAVSEFVTSNMIRIQRILEKNGDYLSLSPQDRSILLRNTVKYTGCFGGTFVLHHAHLLDDPSFYKSSELIFGSNVMLTIKPLNNTYDSDIIFIKLIHAVLSFSTINYTVYNNTPHINLTNLKLIMHIQDTYTELTWRYLVYKYSEKQAVKRFCNLLRCLFNVHSTIITVENTQKYTNMIDTIIEQTEDLLISNK